MEIPEINMLSDFEAGMKCLQNPSFLSRFSPFSDIEKVPQVYSFWKWGALIFAIFATFSSIVKRIKLIFIHFHTIKPSSHRSEEVVEFSDDDDDISSASSDDEHEVGENSQTTSFSGDDCVNGDFCVKGSCLSFRNHWQNGPRQRRRRNSSGAWSEFSYGKNVVKLWDSLGLRLDFDEDLFSYDTQSVVSTWDRHQDQKYRDFSGGVWNIPAAAPMASPTVVLTAEGNAKGDCLILGGYDTRMGHRVPALYAEWSSPAEKVAVAGVATGGIGKVYVRDDVSGVVTVGDVRNVRRPLGSVKESDGDTWWDADAVIVENEFDTFG